VRYARAITMTHRQRILADRLVAVPVAFLLNGITRLLGKAMRRDHSMSQSNIRHIVVAKLIGMGSILQATPLLKALKRQYPQATITFVTMRSNRDLVNRLSCVDEALVLDDSGILAMASATLRIIVALIRRRADLYFDLEVYSAFASLLALASAARNRIGFYRHSVAFKKGIYTHLVFFNTRIPVRRLYLQLGRVMGVPRNQTELTGPIRVDDAGRSSLQRIFSESPGWQAQDPYIVVNPNASDLLLERRWPAEYVVETLTQLVHAGHQIALIGIGGERPYVQSLFDRLSPDVQSRVNNTAGRLTLGELLAALEGAACILTNDTGPMHMAIALGRPTVCLFGPADPEHYGQDLDFVEIFYFPVFCSPCLYEADEPPCHGDNICMQRILPEPVIQAVHRLVCFGPQQTECKAGRRLTDLRIVGDSPNGTPLGLVVRASLLRTDVP
jgi:ADP-heptose:LPS heptosyltransferase